MFLQEVVMWSLFKDKNEINEKNVVGFASFVVMVLFAVADLGTSVLADKDLIINEVVYNSFVWVTLGCFGISSFEKVKSRTDNPSNLFYVALFARRGKSYPSQLIYGEKTNDDGYVVFPWDKSEFKRSQK